MITFEKPTYDQFLRSKIQIAPDKGLEFLPEDVHPALKPHQRDSVLWALKGGQRALFSAFGLGKTITQLEIMRLLLTREDGKDDINRMHTLNSEQSRKELEMHICPLQIDIVDRIIERYTNKGDTVLDPFAGLMTVPLCAVKKGRKGIGIELNAKSYHDGLFYLKEADLESSSPTLFDFIENEKAV